MKAGRKAGALPAGQQYQLLRWSNAKAGLVGFLAGAGLSPVQIAKELADGTSDGTIRRLLREWGVPVDHAFERCRQVVSVMLGGYDRRLLAKRAQRLGITPEEWARRVAVAAIADDLHAAITDGRFDKPGRLGD